MTFGFRTRLFLSSLALIVFAGLISGLYLDSRLRRWLGDRMEREMIYEASLAARLVEADRQGPLGEGADDLVDLISRTLDGARVTLILTDGSVLADSDLSREQTQVVENHGSRPEIIQALAGGTGTARRYSDTVTHDMLYVAATFTRSEATGVVRVAIPLVEEQQVVEHMRRIMVLAALLGLALALVISLLVAHQSSRRLRELAHHTRAVARGGGRRRMVRNGGGDDEIGGIEGSINQIAEQLEATVEALAAERDRFEAVLESMNEAVLALDEHRRITLVNRTALTLLGLKESPVGRTLIETVRIPALQDLVVRAQQGESGGAEFELPEPRVRYVLAQVAPLRLTGGTVLVLHDTTELRRLEAVRRDFVANVSHELRTPISIIRANAETLLSSSVAGDAQPRRFMDAILRQAERLSVLVADLLDISRLESGAYSPELKSVSLLPIVRRAVHTLQGSADEKEQTIQVSVPEELRVKADPRALDQVLLNLLENAVKFAPRQGTIRVEAGGSGQAVRLEVHDDGPGVEPRHRSRLFERFYRADEGRSRDQGGSGLGLAIVKHLAEAMGGSVGYEPGRPEGSIFWIMFPPGA